MTDTTNNMEEYLYALAASPNFEADQTLFSARSSGLFSSTNQGRRWTPAYESLGLETALPTTAVAFSPDFAQDQIVFAAVEGNILRSKDRGGTWQYTPLAEPAPIISQLGISPTFADDGLVLAATLDDGIVRTTNRGASWQRWNFGLLDPHIYTLAFTSTGEIFAGAESGIFISTNAGRAWREVDFPMEFAPVISLAASGQQIFAGTEDHGLYLSGDRGSSWQPVSPDSIQGSVLQVEMRHTSVLAVTAGAVWYSLDHGRSWKSRTGLDNDAGISSIAAPAGFTPEQPLWVGLANARVLQIE